jgi:hypothetical protein
VLGDGVVELELPEPGFTDLPLVNAAEDRGLTPGEVEPAPLKGLVLVGGPHGFRLTADRLAADPELSRFIEQDATTREYYFVHLAVSFPAQGSPKLRSAQVRLTLTSVPGTPEPFALDIKPLKDGDQVSVQRTVRFGPKLKLLDAVGAEVGGVENVISFQRADLVVRGVGLDSSSPGWEFTRTASQKLEGACRLELIVQTGQGVALSVSGAVTAQAGGNIPWPYRGDLPGPLTFGAVL